MDELLLLDATERYLRGEMSEQERAQFEELRKTNPEVDQFVVSHHFFNEEIERYSNLENFKATLNDVHHTLQESGDIKEYSPAGKGTIVYLWNRYKRTIAVAASIAGVTTLLVSSMVWVFTPKPDKQIEDLAKKVTRIERNLNNTNIEINNVKKTLVPAGAQVKYTGSGFLIDGKGFLVTNAHVIKNNRQGFLVQNSKGEEFAAKAVWIDNSMDVAILKIDDKSFKTYNTLPYSIKKSSTELAEPIYTLGYPKDEIVYGEGYLSAKTGFQGDTLACQITISANPGNSGGPVLNKNGEVIGILSTRQTTAEGVVFAIKSKNILKALDELKKDTAYQTVKLPSSSSIKGLDRVQQVKKIEDCVFMIKVY
jgi:serine protease Do